MLSSSAVALNGSTTQPFCISLLIFLLGGNRFSGLKCDVF